MPAPCSPFVFHFFLLKIPVHLHLNVCIWGYKESVCSRELLSVDLVHVPVCVSVFSRSTVVCVVRKYQFPPDPISLISCCLYLSLLWFTFTVNKSSLWFDSPSVQELLQSHSAGQWQSGAGFLVKFKNNACLGVSKTSKSGEHSYQDMSSNPVLQVLILSLWLSGSGEAVSINSEAYKCILLSRNVCI